MRGIVKVEKMFLWAIATEFSFVWILQVAPGPSLWSG